MVLVDLVFCPDDRELSRLEGFCVVVLLSPPSVGPPAGPPDERLWDGCWVGGRLLLALVCGGV